MKPNPYQIDQISFNLLLCCQNILPFSYYYVLNAQTNPLILIESLIKDFKTFKLQKTIVTLRIF